MNKSVLQNYIAWDKETPRKPGNTRSLQAGIPALSPGLGANPVAEGLRLCPSHSARKPTGRKGRQVGGNYGLVVCPKRQVPRRDYDLTFISVNGLGRALEAVVTLTQSTRSHAWACTLHGRRAMEHSASVSRRRRAAGCTGSQAHLYFRSDYSCTRCMTCHLSQRGGAVLNYYKIIRCLPYCNG